MINGRRVRLVPVPVAVALSIGRTAEDRVGRPHRLALRADLRRVRAPHEPVQSSAVQGSSVQRMAGQLSAVQYSPSPSPSPRLTCMAAHSGTHQTPPAGGIGICTSSSAIPSGSTSDTRRRSDSAASCNTTQNIATRYATMHRRSASCNAWRKVYQQVLHSGTAGCAMRRPYSPPGTARMLQHATSMCNIQQSNAYLPARRPSPTSPCTHGYSP